MPCCGGDFSPYSPELKHITQTDAEVELEAQERGVKARPKEKNNEINEKGEFVRQPNHFSTPFGEGEGELKAEAGRYRLYWGKTCNWSNRSAIAIELLGLQNAISTYIVSRTGETNKYGWGFPEEPDHRDPVTGYYFLSEAYYKADPDYSGRCTVPALIDITTGKVVNNDYHRLTNYLESAFRPFMPEHAPNLYPEELREEIDRFNDWLYPNINNARYRMAFCTSLSAYQEAFNDFYNAMDQLEERLAANRFLFGDYVTDSDIRFFVTLARFDTTYYRDLGPIKKRVVDYDNIWAYARDLYEIPAFRNNTYFRDFSREPAKGGRMFASFNSRFVDIIDYEGIWSQPQNRKALSKTPEEKFLRF